MIFPCFYEFVSIYGELVDDYESGITHCLPGCCFKSFQSAADDVYCSAICFKGLGHHESDTYDCEIESFVFNILNSPDPPPVITTTKPSTPKRSEAWREAMMELILQLSVNILRTYGISEVVKQQFVVVDQAS